MLYLGRRKTALEAVLRRQCWCPGDAALCPVHGLGEFFRTLDRGVAAFPFTPGAALGVLREMLRVLRVPRANEHRGHDLRRGHSQDLVERGADLATLLAAGQWRSCAFLD